MKGLKNNKNYFFIFIIFIITCILLFKLFTNPRYAGHDTVFHAMNIVSLSETISLTNLFGNDIVQITANEFGYGVWLFYPKIPHLLAAYLYLFLQNIYLSMNMIYFITMFLSGVFCYFLANNIFKDNLIALLSAVIYMTYPYHLSEIYIRDAFAENFIFFVLPVILLGLEYLKQNKTKLFYIFFAGGYIIGIHSHLLSMIFLTIFVITYLFFYRSIFFTKINTTKFIISSVIILAISAPFLINIIEHKLANIYTVYLSESFTNIGFVCKNLLELKQLYTLGSKYNSIHIYAQPLVLFLCISSLCINVFLKKSNKFNLFLIFSILLSIVLLSSSLFYSLAPKFLLMIQYPFRILLFLSFFSCLYGVISVFQLTYINIIILKRIIIVIEFFFVFILTYYAFYHTTNYRHNKYEISIDSIIDGISKSDDQLGTTKEYLPLTNLKKIYRNKLWTYAFKLVPYQITSKNIEKITIIEDNFPNLKFIVPELNKKTELNFPRTYYLGYFLFNERNEEIKLTMNEHGMLSATVDKGGIYSLEYKGTIYERIGEMVRFFTILLLLLLFIKSEYIQKIKKKPL